MYIDHCDMGAPLYRSQAGSLEYCNAQNNACDTDDPVHKPR